MNFPTGKESDGERSRHIVRKSSRSGTAKALLILLIVVLLAGLAIYWEEIPDRWKGFLPSKSDVDVADEQGITSLMRASLIGRAVEVRDLIRRGADVNAKDKDGETALMAAAYSGYPEVVTILLEHGADANARASNGNTALKCATMNRHHEVRAILLKRGATH